MLMKGFSRFSVISLFLLCSKNILALLFAFGHGGEEQLEQLYQN